MSLDERVRTSYQAAVQRLRTEAGIFLCAWLCFTRIPLPSKLADTARADNHPLSVSARYAPAAGLVIGVLCSLILVAFALLLDNKSAGIVAALAMGALVTGAVHEDGSAHFVEAFWTRSASKDAILERLKDPWLRTPGCLVLIGLFLGQYALLARLDLWHIAGVLIAAHAFARFAALSLVFGMARADDANSTTPASLPPATFLFMAAFGMVPLLLTGNLLFLLLVPLLWVVRACIGWWSVRRVGGWTADTISMVIAGTLLGAFVLMNIATHYAFSI